MEILRRIFRYARARWGGYYLDIDGTKEKIKAVLSDRTSILDQQGFIQGTDKASLMTYGTRLGIGHDYLRHYDYLFSQFRQDKFSLIEFGCFRGDSLRMWEEYFPNAQIYGVDLDESARQHESERIHVVIGDATSQETHDELKAKTGGRAFIILDDASHAWSDQRRSFELFWDIVSPGGFYVIEDLVCGTLGAYPAYPPKVLDAQPFFGYMQDRCEILRWCVDWQPEERSYHFADLPPQVQTIEREMDMCMFIPGAVIVRKKG
ncbi:MAG: class I SAM-dependent methyltransferase [Synergistaceae bacterium]|nr:class I SAM-dependent methyltransferase [Synergistaceae bacterium]